MYNLIIDRNLANKILNVYWDRNSLHFPIIKKINDIDFKVVDYFSKYNDTNIHSIYFGVFSSPLPHYREECFGFKEFVTLEFESEELALYFQLKYGG